MKLKHRGNLLPHLTENKIITEAKNFELHQKQAMVQENP